MYPACKADGKNHIMKPFGGTYMEEVTSDDIRLALVPQSKKSEELYNKVYAPQCVFTPHSEGKFSNTIPVMEYCARVER